jgi:xanthine dehydrogenase accessory factor
MNIVAAVLAAGASRRLGRPKQLVVFRGQPLVQRALAAVSHPSVAEIAVVLGANAADIAPVIGEGVTPLYNESWYRGIASSIRAAVEWADRRRAGALVVALVDQPLVEVSHVGQLVAAWRRGSIAAASMYAGMLGAPAIFDARLFCDLEALQGDVGAASILRTRRGVARVECPEAAIDVDIACQLEALDLYA